MALRKQHVPWKAAGRATETGASADEVVRDIGWVFNNETGERLSLAEFVATGDAEVGSYLHLFGLASPANADQTIVEIGSGIGRMTAAFSRLFATAVACDLDAAFLERCRETVAQFGIPAHLQTSHVADGRTLSLEADMSDLTFSYITLQHCEQSDALALTTEAVRVTRPGGRIALNYRTWTARDVVLYPAGVVTRLLWKVPRLGGLLARWRVSTRLGWQANRLSPATVIAHLQASGCVLDQVQVFQSSSRRPVRLDGVEHKVFDGINPSHWWLVATVAPRP
jgi:SAM-dependent methyltransferase